jgi:hypothetical protein
VNCDHVRVYLGVADELDEPTRRAVETHVRDCSGCARAWSDELEFRRLMSTRRPPEVAPDRRFALLAVPPPGYAALRMRLLARWMAPAIAAATLAFGGSWWALHRQPPRVAPSAEPLAAALPTAVLRQAPVRLLSAETEAGVTPPDRLARADDSGSAPLAPASPRQAAPASPSGPVEPPPLEPSQPVLAAAEALPDGASDPGDESGQPGPSSGGDEPLPEATPADEPPPTAEPTEPPQPVMLRVIAVTDLAGGDGPCSGCDGITAEDADAARDHPLGKVVVAIASVGADGRAGPATQLTLAAEDHGTAFLDIPLDRAGSYTVTLVSAEGGFTLCRSQQADRVVLAAQHSDGAELVTFVLGNECPISGLGAAPPPGTTLVVPHGRALD